MKTRGTFDPSKVARQQNRAYGSLDVSEWDEQHTLVTPPRQTGGRRPGQSNKAPSPPCPN